MVTANQKSTIDTHTKRKSNPNMTRNIVIKSQKKRRGKKGKKKKKKKKRPKKVAYTYNGISA